MWAIREQIAHIAILVSLSLFVYAPTGVAPSGILTENAPMNDYEVINREVSLGDVLFYGGGEWITTRDDSLIGLYSAFSNGYYGIPGCIFTYAIDNNEFRAWTETFAYISANGWRDPREANMVSLIVDFGLTIDDYIHAYETELKRPITEIDALVTWARGADFSELDYTERMEASFWIHQPSLKDIEALFSMDVDLLWEAFPGNGVYHNGAVYTPEWIIYNIERAIFSEKIPLEEIGRIIAYTEWLQAFDEAREKANSVYKSELAWRNTIGLHFIGKSFIEYIT